MLPTALYQKMTHYLRIFYSTPFYQQQGITHPLLWFPAHPDQRADVDSVLGRLYVANGRGGLSTAPQFPVYDHGYLNTIRNSGRNVFNGVTFSLKTLKTNPLKIDGQLGYYFDMLATCAAFERELRDAAAETYIRLPARSRYHREVQPLSALRSGRGRSAAIGGACLLVFKQQGRYQAVLGRRSARAATDPGFFHLLPAFIFQPLSATVQEGEWSIRRHIYREFLEELFGMPEVSAPERLDYFAEHPALVDLEQMLATGQAGLYLTGISLNLLTLRPEISALLLIHDENWYARVTAPASPFRLDVEAETQQGLTLVPIESDAALLAALPPAVHTIMPPQATAALWEGVALARQLLQ
jgi:hypothetical protein